jgi:hypothetical protein
LEIRATCKFPENAGETGSRSTRVVPFAIDLMQMRRMACVLLNAALRLAQ